MRRISVFVLSTISSLFLSFLFLTHDVLADGSCYGTNNQSAPLGICDDPSVDINNGIMTDPGRAGYNTIDDKSGHCSSIQYCHYPVIGCGQDPPGQTNNVRLCVYGNSCGNYLTLAGPFNPNNDPKAGNCANNLSDGQSMCCDISLNAPLPTAPPPDTSDCVVKDSGFCADIQNHACQGAPSGFDPSITFTHMSDDQGCTKFYGGVPMICCVPSTCAKSGGQCSGTNGITARCCDPGSQCKGIRDSLSQCTTCTNKAGGSCPSGFDSDCCYGSGLKCDTTGAATGKVNTCYSCTKHDTTGCVMTGPQGATNNSNCCIAGDVCTNSRKCEAGGSGLACDPANGDKDCFPGQHCINKVCVGNATPPDATVKNPCPNNICFTAIGNIDVSNGQSFITKLFQVILSLAGGIALLLIIYAGYSMIISQGNPEKVQGVKETLTSAIIGLVFVILSVTILQVIGVDILKLPGFTR